MYRLIPLLAALFLLHAAPAQTPAKPAGQPELFTEIDSITADLSRLTGWKAPKKIDSDTITKEGVKQFLNDRIEEFVKPEELRAEEIAIKKLGFVPADFDLRRMTVELLTEQAAAFYDYRKKKLFVLDSNATLMQRPVLVHELAHALADAQHNLGKYLFKGKSDDAALARQAVMEGQATWLMTEYMLDKMGTSLRSAPHMADLLNRFTNASSGMYPVFDSAPLYLKESMLFPYTKGFLFQQEVIQKYDKEGFSEVFKNPPLSTQQILHPDKYFAKVQPTRPDLPKVETRGYDDLVEGTIGEFDHLILLRLYAGESESALAAEWRGARFRILENRKNGRFLTLYASDWTTPEAAKKMFGHYRKVLAKKWKKMEVRSESQTELSGAGDEGNFKVTLDGTRVTSVEGLPAS